MKVLYNVNMDIILLSLAVKKNTIPNVTVHTLYKYLPLREINLTNLNFRK